MQRHLLLFAACSLATAQDDGTGRDVLFSDPTADLPDVYISESVLFLDEGRSSSYTVQLTHQPGMREDETVDMMNDEVRIYLTSSQEVFQQDDAGPEEFQQRVGHRTQLVIDTNVASISAGPCVNDATCSPTQYTGTPKLAGPLPYTYVAYSTVNPTQPSPKFVDSGSETRYQVVCPVCTHAAYCEQTVYDDSSPSTIAATTISGTIFTPDTSFTEEAFDGCTKVTYKGYAPVYDKCSSFGEVYSGYNWPRIAGSYTPSQCYDSVAGTYSLAKTQQWCTGFTTNTWVVSRCSGSGGLVYADSQHECETNSDGAPTGNIWAEQCVDGDGTSASVGTGITQQSSCTGDCLGTGASNCVWEPWTDAATWDIQGCYDYTRTAIDTLATGYTGVTDEATCEGTLSGNNVYFPARCVLTVTEKDGTTKKVNYDGDDVLGSDGQVDRLLCEAAQAASIVESLPGVKGGLGNGQKDFSGGCLPTLDLSTFAAPLGSGTTGTYESGTDADDACGKTIHEYSYSSNTDTYTAISPQPDHSSMSCFPLVGTAFDSVGSCTADCFDGVTGILTEVAMGGEDPAWLTHPECWNKFTGQWMECALSDCNGQGGLCTVPASCTGQGCLPVPYDTVSNKQDGTTSGSSDLRIRKDGSPVLRDIPRVDDYCRYCAKPGLKCDQNGVSGFECVKDTINGGDTAPNQPNWLYPNYASGPSWRGDLSSGAQLVFDSTNWATPQTVIVAARDDDVYEPAVFGRGQDAYVHHYVVAQDINLQHTYYENIDVNDVVVSITDNDPALVMQSAAVNVPTEGQDYHTTTAEVVLRLASEPMYDVTVYLQSGSFFSVDAPTSADHLLPDDEQVIYQDSAQYDVCFDTATGLRSVTTTSPGGKQQHDNVCTGNADIVRAGSGNVHACDPDGVFVRPESFKDVKSATHVRTTDTTAYELPTGWICTGLETQADCEQEDNIIAAGCKWVPEPFEWVPCSCVGYDNDGDGNADPLPHDGTAYPVCLDTDLTGEIASSARTSGSGLSTTGIDINHCERVGTAFSDVLDGEPTDGNGVAECTEGCNTWWNGVCTAPDGSPIPSRTTKDQCIMTGAVWEGKSCGDAAANDMLPAATEDDCTDVRPNHYWEPAPTCTGGTDPQDCATRAGGTCDEANCEFIANTWEEVSCVDATSGTPAPAPATNQGSQQECEGIATGSSWDGSTCDDGAAGGTNGYATEEECTGLTGFTWRGNSNLGGAYSVDATGPLGLCDANPADGGAATTDLMNEDACTGADSAGDAPLSALSQATGSTYNYDGTCYEFGESGGPYGPVVALSCDTAKDPDSTADNTPLGQADYSAEPSVCAYACTLQTPTPAPSTTTNGNAFSTATTSSSTYSDKGFCRNSVNGMIETSLDNQLLCESTAAYDAGDAANSATGTGTPMGGTPSEVRGSCESVASTVNSKSMDMVCASVASPASECDTTEGCEYRGSTCVAEDLGYDCNSYLVFTSTTWNTWQTVKAIAVADDEDETLAKPQGTDTSEVGYLYTSRDWYYNSPGSSLLSSVKTEFVPAAPWSPGTPDGGKIVQLSMFDTRYGSHINRYPWTYTGSMDTELTDSGLDNIIDCSTSLGTIPSAQLAKAYNQNGDSTWLDPNQGTQGVFIGDSFTAYDFSSASEDLVVLIDTVAVTITFDTDVQTVSDVVDVLNAAFYRAANPAFSIPPTAPIGALATVSDGYVLIISLFSVDTGSTVTINSALDSPASGANALALLGTGSSIAGTATSNDAVNMARFAVITTGGHVDVPGGYVDEPKYGCQVKPPQTVDAMNKVCTESAISSTSGYTGQVTTFAPAQYAEPSCGAASNVVDTNVRQVTISRNSCQATEGRRWYHKNFDNQLNPTDVEWTGHIRGQQRVVPGSDLPTTLGLFTTGADLSATVLEGALEAGDTTAPLDLWTAAYVKKSEVEDFSLADTKLSMPVCPFTVVLEASPLEGATVVVNVFEDPELSTLRDNELYFFEEPTFRIGVANQVECETHFPGSVWLTNHIQGQVASERGACYIQNVPYDGLGDSSALIGESSTAVGFRPRGGKSLEVMFTDADWDVPRRITAIALNDDVDEPDETRVIYFDTSGTCSTGKNHNPGTRKNVANPDSAIDCIEDELYNDAIIVTGSASDDTDTITVEIFDDDIADLVVLCGDNSGGSAADRTSGAADGEYVDSCAAATTSGACTLPGCFWADDTGTCTYTWTDDENFIGSYDASHQHNRWDENTVRMGAYAEHGMSYSMFGGGLSTLTDGITGQYETYADKYEATQGKGLLQISLAAPLDADAAVGASVDQAGSSAAGTLRRAALAGDSVIYVTVTSGTFTLVGDGNDDITVDSATAVSPAAAWAVPYNAGLTHTFNFGSDGVTHTTHNDWRSCSNCGYTSIMTTEGMNDARCTMRQTATDKLNTLAESAGTGPMGAEEGCYPDTVASWIEYDPYTDKYCTAAHTAGVVTTTATVASDVSGSGTVTLDADPGTYYLITPGMTVTGGATSGVFTGDGFTAYDFTSAAEDLIVDIDGASQTISFGSDVTDVAAVTALLNARLVGAVASDDGSVVSIASLSKGTGSTVAIGGGSGGNAALLLGTGSSVAGSGISTEVTVTSITGNDVVLSPAVTLLDDDVLTFQSTNYGPHCSAYVDTSLHVRGFKGVGPAHTEPADQYVCTVHSRECHDVGTPDDTTDDMDSTGNSCVYGTVSVRLNSSPGMKTVRRQYAGVFTPEMDTVLETELVHIVVTPDETPQTRFEPTSVTFTHTGGKVDGAKTYRWDEPVEIKVVPKDDSVDERAGVIVDFTAFTVTQSHFYDEYWLYTTPYMNMDKDFGDSVGAMCEPHWDGSAWESCKSDPTGSETATGRYEGHTLYRHTIRTIHTMDNDFSGVRQESPVAVSSSDRSTSAPIAQTKTGTDLNQNHYTHDPVALAIEEGSMFAYYTLQLDTQPSKIQRQSGTSPNNVISWATNAVCGDVESAASGDGLFGGSEAGDFYNDWTDATRPYACGSVEQHTDYWVDVTVTQTIHVEVLYPASCPTSATTNWGGGSGKTWASGDLHPRFPFNGKFRGQYSCPYPDTTKYASQSDAQAVCGSDAFKLYDPFDELVDEPSAMDGYLTTCGGWQRDATFRFTASNWNIPQYVYIYAHNDKDAPESASGENNMDHVELGGNDETDAGETTRSTVLKHYIETEDTLDNMQGTKKFVQWNKFGGVYTYGNIERFPFGYSSAADADNARTDGDVRYGSLDETGYTTWGYSKYESLYGYGYFIDGVWSTAGCCSTAMGGTWGATQGGIDIWGTTGGYGGTDSNGLGFEFRRVPTTGSPSPWCTFARPGTEVNGIVTPGEACVDHITGDSEPRPYTSDSDSAPGSFCTPVVGRLMSDGSVRGGFCVPRFATSYQTYVPTTSDDGLDYSSGSSRDTGHALKFVPNDVTLYITDNDQISDQTNPIADCKQTQYFMWSDTADGTSDQDAATGALRSRSKWLVDYNCDNGDAGALPGYPANSVTGSGYDQVRTGAAGVVGFNGVHGVDDTSGGR